MKILLAADGSKFTKKALAFLVTHEGLCAKGDELVVLHVQPPVPPRVKSMVGASVVQEYHRDEARQVLDPITKFLARHAVNFRCVWHVGPPATEILGTIAREKPHMVIMGTHGRGLVGRALMGSVAQQVLAASPVPVLLVK